MKKDFWELCNVCGYDAEEMQRIQSGEAVVKYRFIPTLEELTRVFVKADDEIRMKRAEVFFKDRKIMLRSRIGQGIHDRAEKILFARGEKLSEYDIAGMKKHQPHPVKFFSALNFTVKAGECYDFSAHAADFDLPLGDDLFCSVNIGTLTLEDGASICVKGNLFSFACQKLIKKGKSETPDIWILPTMFSYSFGFHPYGATFDGKCGEDVKSGGDGEDALTPSVSNSIFGTLHFGNEWGVKNGKNGGDGENGKAGEDGLCGGAAKTAEVIISDMEADETAFLRIVGKAGDGGNGGNGGDGGNGGNGGCGGDTYAVYTPDGILSFPKGHSGNGGNGGCGGDGGRGGNGGICSNIFVEVPSAFSDKIICLSENGIGGKGGKGGNGGAGGAGEKNGTDGKKGADGMRGHDRQGPPMYVNSVLQSKT